MRVLSGVQPSGTLHLGNYFGAIRQHIALQHDHSAFYFIANYHAMTTVQDAPQLADFTHQVACDYLALGLDPQRAVFYRQSDVPEVCELAWVLSVVTGMGLLERAHSYKDKVARGLSPSMGLFSYPVLMAADILIVKAELVPVGADQVQHIEMTQDMAGYFNNTYKTKTLVYPRAHLPSDVARVPGIDGEKMSKSYGNTIGIFEEPKALRKKVMAIKTDSRGVADPKDPETCHVMDLLKLVAEPIEVDQWAERYRSGGMGYGEVKSRLAELLELRFGLLRERRREIAADRDYVDGVLAEGAKRARLVTGTTMEEVRRVTGLGLLARP